MNQVYSDFNMNIRSTENEQNIRVKERRENSLPAACTCNLKTKRLTIKATFEKMFNSLTSSRFNVFFYVFLILGCYYAS